MTRTTTNNEPGTHQEAAAIAPKAKKASKRRGKKLQIAPPTARVTTVGLDVSEKTIQFCEIDTDGAVVEGRLPNTASKIREHFERSPRRVVIEMGTHTRWITELLQELGHEVLVVDARRVQLISKSIYKDDKIDAQTLALIGYENSSLIKTVPIRSLAHQKILTMVRARAIAVTGRTRVVNSIRGLLKPYGLRAPKDGSTKKFMQSLWSILEGDDDLLNHITGLLLILKTMNEQIARYDEMAMDLLPLVAPEAVHLTEIPGVASLTTLYFVAIVGDPNRFGNARDLGAYLGLCRGRDDSGEFKSEMRITKAGDSYMRALLTNCAAHILGPFGVDSDLRRWGLAKVGGGTRAEKRKAKVAVARKLAIMMLTLWRTGRHFDRFHHSNKIEAKLAA